jgi:hypothetical protein
VPASFLDHLLKPGPTYLFSSVKGSFGCLEDRSRFREQPSLHVKRNATLLKEYAEPSKRLCCENGRNAVNSALF